MTTIECPKCGGADGWDGPKFVDRSHATVKNRLPAWEVVHRLAWTCRVCGWRRLTPTKDAPPPAPVIPTWDISHHSKPGLFARLAKVLGR